MTLDLQRAVTGLIAGCVALATTAIAKDPELGPAIGDTIPHHLNVGGHPGFSELSGKHGMVLFFVRSINWCPYCQNQVINISAEMASFEERGLSLVFLSYDSAADQNKFKSRKSIRADFISDIESQVIDAFGLRNNTYPEGSFAHGVPHPAIFFIDSDGIVRGKLYEQDYASDRKSYKNRPPVSIILSEADILIGK